MTLNMSYICQTLPIPCQLIVGTGQPEYLSLKQYQFFRAKQNTLFKHVSSNFFEHNMFSFSKIVLTFD